MARRKFVCGNWKMNLTVAEGEALVEALKPLVDGLEVDIGVAPTFTALHAVAAKLGGSAIRLAAQNCHYEANGAFTGEIAPAMLRDVCCSYVIIGHSERRTLFGETDETVAKKVSAALGAELTPILCLGETLDERDAGQTLAVVTRQLQAGLSKVDAKSAATLVVAYEPVWAIGTGRTATPEQAQEVHAHLRAEAKGLFGADFADALRIQYGGSMKPANAAELLAQPDIDGGLIGGASLKAESFAEICKAAAS